MLGIIPSASKTFEVGGRIDTNKPVEGKLYYDETGRLFIYSTSAKRSNPDVGFFPIWDGESTYITKFSNNRNISEITDISVGSISNNINKEKASDIKYRQMKSGDEDVLRPSISLTDNMFTQIIKTIICQNNWTMLDISNMCKGKLSSTQLDNLYSSLVKISFMRMERWNIWTDIILRVSYKLTVYKGEKQLLSFTHPGDTFDTGIVKYNNIVKDQMDPFNKTVRILMVMENINKSTIKGNEEVDAYTINNMFTTIMSDKTLSAQIFSRFIKVAKLQFTVEMFNHAGESILTYEEGA